MKRNVGGTDRIVRYILGTVVLLIGIFVSLALGWKIAAWVVVGAVALITAVTRYCPLNDALDLNTFRSVDRRELGSR